MTREQFVQVDGNHLPHFKMATRVRPAQHYPRLWMGQGVSVYHIPSLPALVYQGDAD